MADRGLAEFYFAKACNVGDYGSCFNLGILQVYYLDKSDENLEKGAASLIKSCKGKVYRACEVLARLYAKGIGVKADSSKSFQHFEEACHKGKLSTSCMTAGMFQTLGMGTKREPEKGILLIKQACDLGSAQACAYIEKLPKTAQ